MTSCFKDIFGMALAALAFWACGSNYETSGNGEFDGYWQLEQMDTLATGGVTDMHDSLIFWAVQHRLVELCNRQPHPRGYGYMHFSVYYHFERTADTLRFLADPLPVVDKRTASIPDPYALLEEIQVYGFSRFDETFRVLQLDDDHMTLQSEVYRMYFRKY